MSLLRATLLALALVGPVLADLPVECYFDDIMGVWSFEETERDGGPGLACDKMGEVVYKRTVKLNFPNTAEDEFGNIGTWTMVYDQGFEVNVGGRSYFAFNYFETTDAHNATSFCNQTFPGWSRDLTVRNWSCFKGTKLGANSRVARATHRKPRASLERKLYRQDERFVDAINRHQSDWQAVMYPQFDELTLGDVFRLRGGQTCVKVLRLLDLMPSSLIAI